MIVLESKLKGKQGQYLAIDNAIRTALFIRNKVVRFWMDNQGVARKELMQHSTWLRSEFEWCKKLNSMACQASVDRAWFAISRFYSNCKAKLSGNIGYPKFKKRGYSVEYKISGWKLSEDRKRLSLTDGFDIGTLRLIGTRDLNFYQLSQIKRVRIVRRADGYYAQFCIDSARVENPHPTGKETGIDVGLECFYTDSEGNTVENPRYLRKCEKSLKRSQKRVSKKFKRGEKASRNYVKAKNRLARKHLKVSRQRKDFAVKTARALIQSSDLVVYENLQVKNLVKNHKLAKSINDASWSLFIQWVEYLGKVYGVVVRSVNPAYTSQDCSNCGNRVKKTLSTRTHICQCGYVLNRDHNAAINILRKSTVGHTESKAWGQNDLCRVSESLLDKLAV